MFFKLFEIYFFLNEVKIQKCFHPFIIKFRNFNFPVSDYLKMRFRNYFFIGIKKNHASGITGKVVVNPIQMFCWILPNRMLFYCLNNGFIIFYFLKKLFNVLSEINNTLVFFICWKSKMNIILMWT